MWTQWIFCTRSHNRSRRSQARIPRGSIEIAICAIFRTTCATSTSQTRAGTRKFARLVWNFRRWAIVLWLYLSALITFQGLNNSIYNACTVQEWANIIYRHFEKGCRKSGRDNPEKYCGWFWVHSSSKKFERMAWEAMDLCLRVLKESNERRFESNSVREHCIDHIPFYQKKKKFPFYLSGLSRAHFFLTTSLEIAVNISSLRPSHSKPMVFKVNDVLAWAGCNVGYRNTFFAKTSRSYNGPAVRI